MDGEERESPSRHEDSEVSGLSPAEPIGDPSSETEKQGWGQGDQGPGLPETEAKKVGLQHE